MLFRSASASDETWRDWIKVGQSVVIPNRRPNVWTAHVFCLQNRLCAKWVGSDRVWRPVCVWPLSKTSNFMHSGCLVRFIWARMRKKRQFVEVLQTTHHSAISILCMRHNFAQINVWEPLDGDVVICWLNGNFLRARLPDLKYALTEFTYPIMKRAIKIRLIVGHRWRFFMLICFASRCLSFDANIFYRYFKFKFGMNSSNVSECVAPFTARFFCIAFTRSKKRRSAVFFNSTSPCGIEGLEFDKNIQDVKCLKFVVRYFFVWLLEPFGCLASAKCAFAWGVVKAGHSIRILLFRYAAECHVDIWCLSARKIHPLTEWRQKFTEVPARMNVLFVSF